MAVYMNGYFEHTKDTLVGSKKYKSKVEMVQEKLTKRNEEAGQQVDATTK